MSDSDIPITQEEIEQYPGQDLESLPVFDYFSITGRHYRKIGDGPVEYVGPSPVVPFPSARSQE